MNEFCKNKISRLNIIIGKNIWFIIELCNWIIDIVYRTVCILCFKYLILFKVNICNMIIDKRIKVFDFKWNRECKLRMKVDIKLFFNFKDE